MKFKDCFALAVSFAIATGIVLGLIPYLFREPIIPLTMSSNELEDWIGTIFMTTNFILYGIGAFILFIWIFKAARTPFMTSEETLSTGFLWWLLLIIYWILGIVIFMSVSFFSGWMDGTKSIEPLFWFPPFVIINGILLFWLPTAIATPRSMRYIPPFAMTLRKLYGG